MSTYLNLKGSIRCAGLRYQDDILGEQLAALSKAARALHCDAHIDSIRAEMNERLVRALALIDEDHGDHCECDGCMLPLPCVDNQPIPF